MNTNAIMEKIKNYRTDARKCLEKDELKEAEILIAKADAEEEKFKLLIQLDEKEKTEVKNELEKIKNELKSEDEEENEVSTVYAGTPKYARTPKQQMEKMTDNNKKIDEETNFGNFFINLACKIKDLEPNKSHKVVDLTEIQKDGSGGFLIPTGFEKKIIKERESTSSWVKYITLKKVNVMKGSRPALAAAIGTQGFTLVKEAALYPDLKSPEFGQIEFDIQKYGGLLGVTMEMVQESGNVIMTELEDWLREARRITINNLVSKKLDAAKVNEIKFITDLKGLIKIINVDLNMAYKTSSIIITNQDGYNWLDTLVDKKDRALLSEDITKKYNGYFKGLPVEVFSNEDMPTEKETPTSEFKIPFYIGSFKQALTLFERKGMSIATSDQIQWTSDILTIKGRIMLDAVVMRKKAFVKGVLTVPADAPITASFEEQTYIDADGNAIDKDGNRIDKNGNTIKL